MDDKMIMENMLSLSKNLCDLMTHGSIESSTGNVHSCFCSSLTGAVSMQNRIYSAMEQRGFYTTQSAEAQKVQQTKQKFASN